MIINKINSLIDEEEQFTCLKQLETTIEEFIDTFNKDISDNDTYKQKMYYIKILKNQKVCIYHFNLPFSQN